MKRRLLTVQGPLQYITGYIAYRHENPPSPDVEDFLLLYDFFCAPEIEEEIADSIRALSASSPWSHIIFIDSHEMKRLMRRRYADSIKAIQARIGSDHFDEVYVCRDYLGHGSPLLLNSYPAAKKVAYGDSFGLVGQREAIEQTNAPPAMRTRLRNFARQLILGEPAKVDFDVAILPLPIDVSGRYFSNIDLIVPTKNHVRACVEQIYAHLPDLQLYCKKLVEAGTSGDRHLYLLSNLSASGLTTASSELNLYTEVIQNCSPSGATIYLKPHPRSTFEVLNQLVDRLKDDYKVILVDDPRFSRIPIELWVELIQHCEVIAMYSTSAINLKYLYDKLVTMPLTESQITKYFVPGKADYIALAHRMIHESLANLDHWDGRAPLWVAP
jgi:hypothetical protein